MSSTSQAAGAPPPANVSGGLPFTRLGHYQILARLGQGGMGDVYLGYEEALKRRVAVKVLPAELAHDEAFLKRFHAEVAANARLEHPNVVPLYYSGQDGEHHFFVMQYVEGESLAQRLMHRGRLSTEESLTILEQCLAGLGAAHQEGLVHRDVKPGNLLLESKTGRALVADFGLVKSTEGSRLTATGAVLGTAEYLAPEQALGQAVDGRADLYALGVVAYQMLSGRLPFQAETPTGMLFQHAYEPPTPLADVAPDVPALLAAIVGKMMAKDPARRYPSCADVLADLRRLRAGEPVSASAAEPFPAGHPPSILAAADRGGRADEMASAIGGLEAQARRCREDAEAAAARAAVAADPEAAGRGLEGQEECQRRAADLEAQAVGQREQFSRLRLDLDRADAALNQLHNQRDLLVARLRVAQAGQGVAGGWLPRRGLATLAAGLGILLLGGLGWYALRPGPSGPSIFD
jgi:tRNA A-37 threonylcarbamoyl transferase component Bud32